MSMFGNNAKDYLYSELEDFVKEHSLEELMDVLRALFEYIDVEDIKIKKED